MNTAVFHSFAKFFVLSVGILASLAFGEPEGWTVAGEITRLEKGKEVTEQVWTRSSRKNFGTGVAVFSPKSGPYSKRSEIEIFAETLGSAHPYLRVPFLAMHGQPTEEQVQKVLSVLDQFPRNPMKKRFCVSCNAFPKFDKGHVNTAQTISKAEGGQVLGIRSGLDATMQIEWFPDEQRLYVMIFENTPEGRRLVAPDKAFAVYDKGEENPTARPQDFFPDAARKHLRFVSQEDQVKKVESQGWRLSCTEVFPHLTP